MASGWAVRDKGKELMWRRHLTAQTAEGVSIRAFCKARGISEQSFHWWRRELRRREGQKAVPAFVPVAVTALPPEGAAAGVGVGGSGPEGDGGGTLVEARDEGWGRAVPQWRMRIPGT